MSGYTVRCGCGYQLEIAEDKVMVRCPICNEQYALHSAFGETGSSQADCAETEDGEEDENGSW